MSGTQVQAYFYNILSLFLYYITELRIFSKAKYSKKKGFHLYRKKIALYIKLTTIFNRNKIVCLLYCMQTLNVGNK